jgi:hypothetical protein
LARKFGEAVLYRTSAFEEIIFAMSDRFFLSERRDSPAGLAGAVSREQYGIAGIPSADGI